MSDPWFEEFPDIFKAADVVEESTCPLCGGDELNDFEPPKEWADARWKKCFCGYLFQSPRPSMESMSRYYEDEYRHTDTRLETHGGTEYPSPKDVGVQMLRSSRQWQVFAQATPPAPKRVLDIGCANGVFLEHAKLYFDSEVFGVELNERDHELMDKKGIPYGRDISDAPGKFNLILMSHVLEHFDYPEKFLQRVKEEVAAEKAWLLMEVPTPKAGSAYSRFHFAVFTQEALFRTLSLSGWLVKSYHEHGGNHNLQTVIGRLP